MRQRHRIRAEAGDDFTIHNTAEIAESLKVVTMVMSLLLGSIAGVSLIVGGVGIMNIMLVSVTERTREIGIRLAVGARCRDILRQFLVEAVVLSLLGGAIGVALGVGGIAAATWVVNTFCQQHPLAADDLARGHRRGPGLLRLGGHVLRLLSRPEGQPLGSDRIAAVRVAFHFSPSGRGGHRRHLLR